MQELTDGILLYHGSYTGISSINLARSRKSLDFWKGFYLTSSFDQAVRYIPSAVYKNIRMRKLPPNFSINDRCLSVYRFHADSELAIHYLKMPILTGFILSQQIEINRYFNISSSGSIIMIL